MELLHEMMPKNARVIALLVNSSNPALTTPETIEARNAARSLALHLEVVEASEEAGFKSAFASLLEKQASAILVSGDPFFLSRDQLLALAALYRAPAIYGDFESLPRPAAS
jgi:putative tryptophan/tyrosine transport system substrate-binding protein